MNKNNKSLTTSTRMGQLRYWLPLLTLVLSGNAWGGVCPGDHQNVDFDDCNSQDECTYALQYNLGSNIAVPSETIQTINKPSPASNTGLSWAPDATGTCSATNLCSAGLGSCLGIPIVDSGDQISFSGNTTTGASGANGCFELTATHPSAPVPCKRKYKIHISSNGGGWGDPHITTVDGVHYDFQSAGEFIALRGDGLEIQTRQTPVSTKKPLKENLYTEISSCVSIYTAVAARVGTHRVTIQPKISDGTEPSGMLLGKHDRSGMLLRIDGVLKTLGPDGIDLVSSDYDSDEAPLSGRIVRSVDDKSYEIRYPNGTKLVVTPAYWDKQEKWYLNVNVYDTAASEGIMGLTKENWLPALSDGNTVGPKEEEDEHLRYVQLYKTFADSWRVSNKTSLFDYAPGTSTETFTLAEWPRNSPKDCKITGQSKPPKVKALDKSIAEEHCRIVEDVDNRENCIIDVMAMGETGFADAYQRAELVTPGATQTSLSVDRASSKPGTQVAFTAVVTHKVATIKEVISGSVQFILDGKVVGKPMALDSNGNAVWSTSNLQRGNHEIEARFLPSGFGEPFRRSSSKVNHMVFEDGWWLSFHAGSTVPAGNFSDDYDPSYSVLLDLEYKFTPKYSFLGLLGYNHFKGASTGVDDTYWANLSANVKYYFTRFAKSGTVWVNAGAGSYKPKSGSARAGANVGVGLGGDINTQWRWEVGINYHNIFTSGRDTRFTVPTVGVTYNF